MKNEIRADGGDELFYLKKLVSVPQKKPSKQKKMGATKIKKGKLRKKKEQEEK